MSLLIRRRNTQKDKAPLITVKEKTKHMSMSKKLRTRIRRNKAEIDAGMPVELLRKGVTLEEFLLEEKKKLDKPIPRRTRRSKEEIDAGMTIEDKKRGLSIEDVKERDTKKQKSHDKLAKYREAVKRAEEEKKKAKPKRKSTKKYIGTVTSGELIDATERSREGYPTRYVYKEKLVEKPVEIEVIKEVRILNGTHDTQHTVQEIMQEELNKCTWEWKEIKETSFVGIKQLRELGEQGWKYAHSMDWKLLKPEWKDKPRSLYFQRPKKKRIPRNEKHNKST